MTSSRSSKAVSKRKLSEDGGVTRKALKNEHDALSESYFGKLPVELLTEIFKQVDAEDLLNLQLTCKRFKAILYDDDIWKHIVLFDSERLGPVLSDMTYRQYVALVAGSRCVICNDRATRIFWVFRRRLCQNCLDQNTIAFEMINRKPQNLNLLPCFDTFQDVHYWAKDVEKLRSIGKMSPDVAKEARSKLNQFMKECRDHQVFQERLKLKHFKSYERKRAELKKQCKAEKVDHEDMMKQLLDLDTEEGHLFTCSGPFCDRFMTAFEAYEHQHTGNGAYIQPPIPNWALKEYTEMVHTRLQREVERHDIIKSRLSDPYEAAAEFKRIISILRGSFGGLYRCLKCPDPFATTYNLRSVTEHMVKIHNLGPSEETVFPYFKL